MTGNAIIDLLLSSESDNLRWLLNDAERTFLQPGVKLQSSGALIGHAVFPLSGMATLAWTLEDGSEVTTIGIGTTDSIHAAPDIDLARSTCHARTYLASEVLKIPAGRWQRF